MDDTSFLAELRYLLVFYFQQYGTVGTVVYIEYCLQYFLSSLLSITVLLRCFYGFVLVGTYGSASKS